jgi:hypothetical protein
LPIGTEKGDSRFASASEPGLPIEATLGLPISVKKQLISYLRNITKDDLIVTMGYSLVAR